MKFAVQYTLIIILFLFTLGCSSELSHGTKSGDAAPPFTIQTIDDQQLQLDNLQGKIVVITSMASWCSTCILEARNFASVYSSLNTDTVVFISISIDPTDTPGRLEEFRNEQNTPWHYATSTQAEQMIIDYRLTRFDTTYVIDPDGIIQYTDTGVTSAEELQNILHNLL